MDAGLASTQDCSRRRWPAWESTNGLIPFYCPCFAAVCKSRAWLTSLFSFPSMETSPIRSSCSTPSASMVKVCGIACTSNNLAICPVHPPSKYCGQVISCFRDEVFPYLSIGVETDAEHHEGLPLEFSGELPHVRHSRDALGAPGRPEVEEHDLALQVVERNLLPIRCRDHERRRHPSPHQFWPAGVPQGPLPPQTACRHHLREVLKAGFCRVILLEACERLAIDQNGRGELGRHRQGLRHLFVSAGKQLILPLLLPLIREHRSQHVVCERYILRALGLGDQMSCRSFGGFPVVDLYSALHHLLLAGQAMPAVLLVGFLEVVEGQLARSLVQINESFFVSFLPLLICRTLVRFLLGQHRRHQAGQYQDHRRTSHIDPSGSRNSAP